METFGGYGEAAMELFHRLQRQRRDGLVQERHGSTSSASTFTSYWRQRISITLQRAIASGFLVRGAADYAAAAGG